MSQALLKFYFPTLVLDFSDNSRFLFNLNPEEAQKLGPAEPRSGILGPREAYLDQAAIAYAFNRWVHNLAQIAPYLYAAAKEDFSSALNGNKRAGLDNFEVRIRDSARNPPLRF